MEIDLSEWEFCITQGIKLVGKVGTNAASATCYEPVFEYRDLTIPNPQGGLMIPWTIVPLMGTLGLRRFVIPAAALRFPIQAFIHFDRHEWEMKIKNAMTETLRLTAAASGLVLPQ